jgi:hypothetical protein
VQIQAAQHGTIETVTNNLSRASATIQELESTILKQETRHAEAQAALKEQIELCNNKLEFAAAELGEHPPCEAPLLTVTSDEFASLACALARAWPMPGPTTRASPDLAAAARSETTQMLLCAAESEEGQRTLTEHINKLEESLENERASLEQVQATLAAAVEAHSADLQAINEQHAASHAEQARQHAAAIAKLAGDVKEQQVPPSLTDATLGHAPSFTRCFL